MWAAARWFATRRRAAFTVATLLVVPSSSLASDKASSSRSTIVLDIKSSLIVMSDIESNRISSHVIWRSASRPVST